jgi:hypothetical protein
MLRAIDWLCAVGDDCVSESRKKPDLTQDAARPSRIEDRRWPLKAPRGLWDRLPFCACAGTPQPVCPVPRTFHTFGSPFGRQ